MATGGSVLTVATAGLGFTGATGVPAFIEHTGLSVIMDTEATGVPDYTAATVGAGLPCIAIAAAGESRLRANVTELAG